MAVLRNLFAVVLLLTSVSPFIFVSSCVKETTPPKNNDTSCTHNGTDTIYYSLDVQPILTTYCTSNSFGDCHGTNSSYGYDFTTYSGLQPYIDGGIQSIFYDYVLGPVASMPKSNSSGPTSIESCDKEKLYYWLLQGAQDN